MELSGMKLSDGTAGTLGDSLLLSPMSCVVLVSTSLILLQCSSISLLQLSITTGTSDLEPSDPILSVLAVDSGVEDDGGLSSLMVFGGCNYNTGSPGRFIANSRRCNGCILL